MINHRIVGTFRIFAAIFLLLNVAAFLVWIHSEYRFLFFNLSDSSKPLTYLPGLLFAVVYILPSLRQYYHQQLEVPSHSLALALVIKFSLLQAIALAFTYVALKDSEISRFFLMAYLPMSLILNLFYVRFVPHVFARIFFSEKQKDIAVILGNGPLPERLRTYLNKADRLGVKFVGYYADRSLPLPALEWLGKAGDLFADDRYRRSFRPDQVLAYTSNFQDREFLGAVESCAEKGVRVQIFSDFSNAFADPVKIYEDDRLHFLTFYDEPLQNPINVACKRMLDVAISLPVCLFILPPLTLLVWIFQKVQSPGPILYQQKRYGSGRRRFTILKYRTMHVRPPDISDEHQQARRGDPRIYGFGRFLRRTSLDEFPQFVNVLKGEMSVVGPRPHLVQHDYEFEKHYRRYRSRHFVKPGITGYAQVRGFRGEVSDPTMIVKRVENDLHYITRWSLRLELYIILKTFWQIFFPPKTAY